MSIWSTLNDDAKAAWATLAADEKILAAMIYNDIKAIMGAAESAVIASMPSIVAQVKAYATQVVVGLENNPSFKNALGSWKFGVASWQVLAAVESGLLPGLKAIGTATVETAVQAAFAAMVTGIL